MYFIGIETGPFHFITLRDDFDVQNNHPVDLNEINDSESEQFATRRSRNELVCFCEQTSRLARVGDISRESNK